MATERTVLVRLKANVSDFQRAMAGARASVKGLTDEIDTTNDRTAWLAQSVLGLGPAFVPLAAGAIPAVSGLATQMTIAAAAAGVAAMAFNGVGDGLKALNDYQLAPTGDNLAKVVAAMDKLGPAGADFVRFLDQVGPKFNQLAMTSREGIFPGMEEGISDFMVRLPQINRIVGELATGMGELAADSGGALASGRFDDFFNYIEDEAKPILMDMGTIVGGFAEGLANLMAKMGPLTTEFSHGFADMATNFAEWSRTLDSNSSFQSFLEYVDEAGPRTMQFLASLTDAFVAILRAAAPVGDILLPALSQLLEIIAHLADTPLGPLFIGAAAAMSIYGRAVALASITTGGLAGQMLKLNRTVDGKTQSVLKSSVPSWRQFGNAMLYAAQSNNQLTRGSLDSLVPLQKQYKRAIESRVAVAAYGKQIAGTASQVGLMAFAASGMADNLGLSNSAMLAMAGNMVGGAWGTAIGFAVGAVLDYNSATREMAKANQQASEAMDSGEVDKMAAALERQRDAAQQAFGTDFTSLGNGDATINPLQNIRRVVGLLNGDMGEMRDQLGQTEAALGASALFSAGQSFMNPVSDAFKVATAAEKEADQALQAYIRTFDAFQGRLAKQQGLIAFRDGLRQLGQTVKDNPLGKGLDATKQGDAVRGQLLGVIQTTQTLAKNMKGLEHIRFMRQARADILARAAELGLPLRIVQRLLNNMGILDRTDARPKIQQEGAERSQARIAAMRAEIAKLRNKMVKMDEKGAAAARARIRALQAAIAALRDKTVTIHVQRDGSFNAPGTGGKVKGLATGGPVIAAQGQLRGPTADSVPIMASHDEYMMRVAAHRYYGSRFMDDVNHMRLPKPRGYAGGGAITAAPRVSVAAPNVNTGDTFVRVLLDGRELRAVIDSRIDERADVAGSYSRASRNADV